MMSIPSRWHICPNCVTGTTPYNCSFLLASRTYTFFQSVYSATGTPYFLTHARNTAAAARIVSSLPMRASVSPLASSTMFIQATTRASFLQPVVKASIHLHQFPHMLFPFSPLAVLTPLPRPTP